MNVRISLLSSSRKLGFYCVKLRFFPCAQQDASRYGDTAGRRVGENAEKGGGRREKIRLRCKGWLSRLEVVLPWKRSRVQIPGMSRPTIIDGGKVAHFCNSVLETHYQAQQ